MKANNVTPVNHMTPVYYRVAPVTADFRDRWETLGREESPEVTDHVEPADLLVPWYVNTIMYYKNKINALYP